MLKNTPAKKRKTYSYPRLWLTMHGYPDDFLKGYCQRTGKKKAATVLQLLKDAINGRVVRLDGSRYFDEPETKPPA